MTVAREASVIWHEAECGGYAADLSLWEQLAAAVNGPVLDLGCGTGRVTSHLTRRGYEVTGLDLNPRLITELAGAVQGDARDFALDRRFALVLAPMQLIQLFDGPGERIRCLECVARHLVPGGLAAFAIVESMPAPVDTASPLPDTREVDGWVYSSLPLDATVDGGAIRVRRLRQTVSPAGELAEELDEIALRTLDAATVEEEAKRAGLRPVARHSVPATEAHVGSAVVLLKRGT
ncbi:MAG TPA: class I SAM-dependent methyltransferase [Solirubrobacterales bacterium]|nr:class I SAM-dependent methyltransferase [Solirubrobacterales bacterium]